MSTQNNLSLGTTGFNLLEQTRNLLSVCTSDGVTAVVLNFLDAFGARFAVSGELCQQIREACNEDRRTILGELKIAVGYRRGDATSILASSSSGLSAIAVIIAATEMYPNEDMAYILTELAEDELPPSITIPSARELNACFEAIHNRCQAFEFCTHYAKLVTAIRRTRMLNNRSSGFDNLTACPPAGMLIGLLRRMLSLAQSDSGSQLRIDGSESMGILAAAVSWWYPSLVLIISEENVIWPCSAPRPRCLVRIESGFETQWWEETAIESLPNLLPSNFPKLSEVFQPNEIWPDRDLLHPTSGFVSGALGSLGFREGPDLDRACAIIATLAFRLAGSLVIKRENNLSGSQKNFLHYLGEPLTSRQYICQSLLTTCGYLPLPEDLSVVDLGQELDCLVFKNVQALFSSDCPQHFCEHLSLHKWSQSSDHRCVWYNLRSFYGELIWKVLLHFLVDSSADFGVHIGSNHHAIQSLLQKHFAHFWQHERVVVSRWDLQSCLAEWLGLTWASPTYLGSSNYGISMYIPAAFWPDINESKLSRIGVAQGAFVHRNNYYQFVTVADDAEEHAANQHSTCQSAKLVSGAIKDVNYTVREGIDDLKVRTLIQDVSGLRKEINLAEAVSNACFFDSVIACGHARSLELDSKRHSFQVLSTSVAEPFVTGKKVCVMSAPNDPKSCLYACDGLKWATFLRDACLECGIRQVANSKSPRVMISIVDHG